MRKADEIVRGCMAKARDDEMTFVLLGRDAAAPFTIREWCKKRIRLGLNRDDDAKIKEALSCAETMETERAAAWEGEK